MKTSRFERGVSMTVDEVAAVVGPEFKEMNENPPPEVLKVREEMQKQGITRIRRTWQAPEPRVAAKVPGGLYGFTRRIQAASESTTRKLSRTAVKIAKRIFARDPDVVPFLQVHAKRDGSRSAKVLLAAMKEIGPKLASNTVKASRGPSEYGLYGFRAATADLGLDACKEVRSSAGRFTAELHRRLASNYEQVVGFLKEHSKQARCIYSSLCLACYPDSSMKFAATDLVLEAGTASLSLGEAPLHTGRLHVSLPVSCAVKGQEQSMRIAKAGRISSIEILPAFLSDIVGNNVRVASIDPILSGFQETLISGTLAFEDNQARPFTALFTPAQNLEESFRILKQGAQTSGGWLEWDS
jgi:hypothetical protein